MESELGMKWEDLKREFKLRDMKMSGKGRKMEDIGDGIRMIGMCEVMEKRKDMVMKVSGGGLFCCLGFGCIDGGFCLRMR
jgi:hypothetical protein